MAEEETGKNVDRLSVTRTVFSILTPIILAVGCWYSERQPREAAPAPGAGRKNGFIGRSRGRRSKHSQSIDSGSCPIHLSVRFREF